MSGPPAGRRSPGPLEVARLSQPVALDVDALRRLPGVLDVGDEREAHQLDVRPRHGRDEAPGVGVLRAPEDLLRRAVLDEPPPVHHRDPVGDVGDHPHVVGDDHHPDVLFLAQGPHEVEDLGLDRDVEGGRRLVGDDHVGLRRERERDHHPLAHAPRELVGVLLHAELGLGDPDLPEEVHGAPPRGRLARPEVEVDGLDELLLDGLEGVQARQWVLEDHPDPLAAELALLRVFQVVDAPS